MDQMLVKARLRFEGQISCECGNEDWLQFIYIGDLPEGQVTAACKKCARAQELDSKTEKL